jgi:hypothetical protein
MLICLWKGCEFACGKLAVFQEHLITKHAQQQPKLNMENQTDLGTEEKMAEEGRNQDENQMTKREEKRQKNNINSH